MSTKIIEVNELAVGSRLDVFLSKELSKTRSFIQKLLTDNLITVNDLKVKNGYILQLNDQISITEEPVKTLDLTPVDMKLNIVYQDDDLVIINKPKNLVVHPSDSYDGNTLVHGLLHEITNLSAINGVIRPGIVHRLDKDTTGLLVVAKNDQAHKTLAADLSKHLIVRKYLALVYGHFKETEGIIDAPIGRHPKDRLKMAVVKDGKPAITHFKVLKSFQDYTLLECELKTGRTHQIRVHLQYIKHPVVGDKTYGPLKVMGQQGQFLDAKELTLTQPTTKKQLTFNSELPEYFEKFVKDLV
jgi:23S rRNA pseudouridine1911/1915/1917 synthase